MFYGQINSCRKYYQLCIVDNRGILYIHNIDFGDLLIVFVYSSIIAGVISLGFVFVKDSKTRYTGLIWFVMNIVNVLFLVPFIIFLLFFVI